MPENVKLPAPIGRILLKNVRLAFASGLFEASVIPGAPADAKPKYNCGLILPPDHPQLADLRAKQEAVAAEKWKDKAKAQLAALATQDKLALHNGDAKPNYTGYPGNFFLSPSSFEHLPPTLLGGPDGRTVLSPADARKLFYSGCYVNAQVDLWAQDNNYGKRINAQLRGVQFAGDGEAFGAGSTASADEFEPVEGSNSDDAFV